MRDADALQSMHQRSSHPEGSGQAGFPGRSGYFKEPPAEIISRIRAAWQAPHRDRRTATPAQSTPPGQSQARVQGAQLPRSAPSHGRSSALRPPGSGDQRDALSSSHLHASRAREVIDQAPLGWGCIDHRRPQHHTQQNRIEHCRRPTEVTPKIADCKKGEDSDTH